MHFKNKKRLAGMSNNDISFKKKTIKTFALLRIIVFKPDQSLLWSNIGLYIR